MNPKFLYIIVPLLWASVVQAQIPVEVFGGDKKASFDVMFFKFFKNKEGQNSHFLFFTRERAVVDYKQTATSNLPQFGFTEALSYNHPAFKGFAPVLVGQVLNRGTFAKTGIQYAHVSKTLTVFGWSVVALESKPDLDLFLLLRYTPTLGKKWFLFSQIELINAFPTNKTTHFSFTQRLRLGLKKADWQFGLGGDFSAVGRKNYASTQNTGLFIRHEF
ncbi:hypothetical protein DR864_23280 [Runella rosea]|uniref:Uncharacterized protein n=1 Tax=Runella rosea TaxID=2259595 RepID=A0A344TP80_9BACT|nr:hypothetical protein [Runella rosea]AXE20451.1 hypothetical protein DR864_23280 [Runella rosea]